MRLKQYITEKRKNNVIVVDIQPEYEHSMRFDLQEYGEFINTQGKILYFYNSVEEGLTADSKQDIIDWLYEICGVNADKLNSNDITWVDKGFGFFRSWMDSGADTGDIKSAIRLMVKKRIYDSRDIDIDIWEKEIPSLYKFAKNKYGNPQTFFEDNIYIPTHIRIDKLKKWSGSFICGGGINECLKEILILLSSYNIKVKTVKRYTF